MTMSTDLIICEPVNAEELWLHVVGLLGRGVDFEPRWNRSDERSREIWGSDHYSTELGQGLAALTYCHFATDGPLRLWDDERMEDTREDDPDFTPPWFDLHCVRLDFDTACGYKANNGARCGDLHAWLLTECAAWLTDRGITKMVWHHEECGDYRTIDRIPERGNVELGRLGALADA